MNKEDIRVAKRKYHAHKGVAKQRGIDFNISFDDWLNIWLTSNHWHERGVGKTKYVMSRVNDIGAYEVGNVLIQLHGKNVSDAMLGKKKSQAHINNWKQSWFNNKSFESCQ
jgi:hypothetical protein